MGWVFWLGGPVVATVVASVVAWWAGRPRRKPVTARAIVDHRRFLSTLDAIGTAPQRSPRRRPSPDQRRSSEAPRNGR